MGKLKQNLIKNGIASSIQKGIRVFEQLVLVPFFISFWGAEYYGEWITLTIIPSMLAFSDLGFGSAAANTFVLRYASGNKQGAANIAKSGLLIITLMVVFGIILSSILLFILDHYNIFDKSLIERQDAIWAVSILMVARILNFYQQLFEAHFRAARRASLSINFLSFYSGLNIIIGLIVLLAGGGVVAFALVNLLVALIFNPIYALKAESILGLQKSNQGIIYKSDIKSITRKGFGYLMSPIWQAIYFQGTTFVVRLTLGATAVAIFNTVRTISRSANQGFSLVSGTIFPELQFEIGKGNMNKARKVFRAALGIVIIMAIFAIIILTFWGLNLYKIWTQNELNPSLAMWNIFILGIGFNALWWTSSIIFRAVNRPYNLAVAGVISAIISVISSYFLSISYGLTGAALGSLILDLILAFYVLPQSCKLLKQPFNKLLRNITTDYIIILNQIGLNKPLFLKLFFPNKIKK